MDLEPPRPGPLLALDPKLWEGMGNNPVRMLETVSPERLSEAAENASYMNLYAQIFQQFDDYMGDRGLAKAAAGLNGIKWSSPVAYFSTEYGLHECLPIYSGGLGTLSGRHLKTASDLNIPLVGVGLLYKNGFFKQVIDKNGIQLAEYRENDFSSMPVQIVQDDRGNAVQISLDLPGRTLFANIWEVKVGTDLAVPARHRHCRETPPRTGRSRTGSTPPTSGPGSSRRSSSGWGACGF